MLRAVYRDDIKGLSDLLENEGLALGGLIRILIRLDGSFSEEEERHVEQVGAALGSAEELWALVSRSAQEQRSDDAIREAAKSVERMGARQLIREALEQIALAETIEPAEQSLLDWLDGHWGTSTAEPE